MRKHNTIMNSNLNFRTVLRLWLQIEVTMEFHANTADILSRIEEYWSVII